jgi:hypothetical protein
MLKSIDLEIRPIYHYREDRVRAHVLLASSRTTLSGTYARPGPSCYFPMNTSRFRPILQRRPDALNTRRAKTDRSVLKTARPFICSTPLVRELGLRARNTRRINDTEATLTDVTKPTPIQHRALALVSELPLAL